MWTGCVAVGEEADRLSRIKQSYHTAARTYAFRYLYDGHILYYNMLEQVKENSADTSKTEAVQLKNVNINALNPEILQKFLSSGLEDEVDSFVHDYFHAIGREPMESLVFRNYVVFECAFFLYCHFLRKLDMMIRNCPEKKQMILWRRQVSPRKLLLHMQRKILETGHCNP